MNNLKKSKRNSVKLLNQIFLKNKSYLVFKINNNNKTVYKFIYKKINKNLFNYFVSNLGGKIYLNVLFDLNNYFYTKKKVSKLLISEYFNYSLSHIKANKNNLSIMFFENNLLLKSNKLDTIKEICLFSYICTINNNIYLKKNLFIIINLFFININIIKLNVYYTSSSFKIKG